jgi:hypothetical protein
VTALQAAAGAAVLAAAAALVARAYLRARISPPEMERRRRCALAAMGKIGDATLHEARDGMLIYAYDVAGVTYTAAQDISTLSHRMPSDEESIFGSVLVKYDPKNPANSIVVSEEWSGFRSTPSKK